MSLPNFLRLYMRFKKEEMNLSYYNVELKEGGIILKTFIK